MERDLLRPAPGLVVRDPLTRIPLPAEGLELEITTYWIRRIADGDVSRGIPVTHPPAQKRRVAKESA